MDGPPDYFMAPGQTGNPRWKAVIIRRVNTLMEFNS